MRTKILAVCTTAMLLVGLPACGGAPGAETGRPDEELFRWMGSTIAGLTEKGEAATELVIPASAELVSLDLAGNSTLQKLSFENDETAVQSSY